MRKFVLPRNIHPLTDFKRNSGEMINHMHLSGDPVVLTVNGKASVVVQDAEAYQRLIDRADEADAVAGIRRGLADVEAGRVRPLARAFPGIKRKIGSSGRRTKSA